jgi:hypothetical protein
MKRLKFFMDNNTTVTLDLTAAAFAEFERLLRLGKPYSFWADNQKGAGRLGDKLTVGVNWDHVVSWQADKL